MPRFFVWLPSQTGPQPQIWHDDEPKNGEGKTKHEPLFKRLIDVSEYQLSLNELAAKYPV